MAESSTSKPGRWLSYRLRTLLAFTVFLAPCLAWLAAERNQSAREHALVRELNNVQPLATRFSTPSRNEHRFSLRGPWHNLNLPSNQQPCWQRTATNVLGPRVADANLNFVSPPEGLSFLREFKSLEHLSISHSVTDISDLRGLHRLTYLRISEGKFTDITPVANLTNLEYLGLYGVRVTDVSPVANLTQLRGLHLHSTQVSDIAPIAKLNELKDLVLTGSPVTDLSPLKSLPSLATLHLAGTPVRDLSALSELPDLRKLSLEHTTIDDVSPLLCLDKLEVIGLRGAKISADNVELLRLTLPNCAIKQ